MRDIYRLAACNVVAPSESVSVGGHKHALISSERPGLLAVSWNDLQVGHESVSLSTHVIREFVGYLNRYQNVAIVVIFIVVSWRHTE